MKFNRLVPRHWSWIIVFALVMFWSTTAHAHIETGKAAGFVNGFKHPWSGWDHICAMIAVGLWGAQLGLPAIWLLPVVFPMVMAFGGFLGLVGFHVPGGEMTIEIGIAMSAVLLGGLVLGEVRSKSKPFLIFAVALVGLFGLCHGYAHGSEMEENQSAILYSIGFVIATGTLHACGIAIGTIHRWPVGRIAMRGAGLAISLAGVFFLWDAMKG